MAMKNVFILFLIITGFGCKKEKSSAPSAGASASIINLWELTRNESNIYINNSFTQGDTTYLSPNEIRVLFKSDLTYLGYENGVVTDSAVYIISGNQLTLIDDGDSIFYTATITPSTLELVNVQYQVFSPDTYKYETKLSLIKK
jgi:hypothetical protein